MEEILNVNELSIIGSDAIVNVNQIKKARYCLQIAICAIYRKLKDAHRSSGSLLDVMGWLNIHSQESEMCFYWRLIMHIELNILFFIRSILWNIFLRQPNSTSFLLHLFDK